MLFDLQGKRRRVVQGTYLMLALLMGGGLVLFGIGGDVSGGLFDAFSGGSKGSSNDDAVQKRLARNEKRLRANPRDEKALTAIVRAHYQLATTKTDPGQPGFSKDARPDLVAAGAAWKRYLKVADSPSPTIANFAFRTFDVDALNRPKDVKDAVVILAQAAPRDQRAGAYVRVVQYATLAKDTRTADLAGQKAVDLAPKGQKKQVRDQVKQAKTPQAAGAAGAQGSSAGG